jgi:hypothetical protein
MEFKTSHQKKSSNEIGSLVIKLFEDDLILESANRIKMFDTKLNESLVSHISKINKLKTLITNIDIAIDHSNTTRNNIISKIVGSP